MYKRQVGAIAKEGAWTEALGLIERELRRAVQFGFTQAEVNEQIANRRTALKNACLLYTSRCV